MQLTRGTEQIKACVSGYNQSAWTAKCTYCKHRYAAVLAHTQGCHIKNETGN